MVELPKASSTETTRSRPGAALPRQLSIVLSGVATAAFDDGDVSELRAGALFNIGPIPHDRWVVGDEPYVSLHFLGADRYANTQG